MLLGVVGRATLASFGSPFFWLDRLVPRLLRVNKYFEDRRQIDPDSRNERLWKDRSWNGVGVAPLSPVPTPTSSISAA
jgi:hypothetical protein